MRVPSAVFSEYSHFSNDFLYISSVLKKGSSVILACVYVYVPFYHLYREFQMKLPLYFNSQISNVFLCLLKAFIYENFLIWAQINFLYFESLA